MLNVYCIFYYVKYTLEHLYLCVHIQHMYVCWCLCACIYECMCASSLFNMLRNITHTEIFKKNRRDMKAKRQTTTIQAQFNSKHNSVKTAYTYYVRVNVKYILVLYVTFTLILYFVAF